METFDDCDLDSLHVNSAYVECNNNLALSSESCMSPHVKKRKPVQQQSDTNAQNTNQQRQQQQQRRQQEQIATSVTATESFETSAAKRRKTHHNAVSTALNPNGAATTASVPASDSASALASASASSSASSSNAPLSVEIASHESLIEKNVMAKQKVDRLRTALVIAQQKATEAEQSFERLAATLASNFDNLSASFEWLAQMQIKLETAEQNLTGNQKALDDATSALSEAETANNALVDRIATTQRNSRETQFKIDAEMARIIKQNQSTVVSPVGATHSIASNSSTGISSESSINITSDSDITSPRVKQEPTVAKQEASTTALASAVGVQLPNSRQMMSLQQCFAEKIAIQQELKQLEGERIQSQQCVDQAKQKFRECQATVDTSRQEVASIRELRDRDQSQVNATQQSHAETQATLNSVSTAQTQANASVAAVNAQIASTQVEIANRQTIIHATLERIIQIARDSDREKSHATHKNVGVNTSFESVVSNVSTSEPLIWTAARSWGILSSKAAATHGPGLIALRARFTSLGLSEDQMQAACRHIATSDIVIEFDAKQLLRLLVFNGANRSIQALSSELGRYKPDQNTELSFQNKFFLYPWDTENKNRFRSATVRLVPEPVTRVIYDGRLPLLPDRSTASFMTLRHSAIVRRTTITNNPVTDSLGAKLNLVDTLDHCTHFIASLGDEGIRRLVQFAENRPFTHSERIQAHSLRGILNCRAQIHMPIFLDRHHKHVESIHFSNEMHANDPEIRELVQQFKEKHPHITIVWFNQSGQENETGNRPQSLLNLSVGDQIDCLDTVKKWCTAQIIGRSGDQVQIHYTEWTSKWDEWLSMTSSRLQPFGTHTNGTHKATK